VLCELCETDQASGFHHFIPRTLHSNKWFKRRYTRREMQQGINLCKSCHSAVHDLIPDEKDLGRHYNTRERLLSHPKIANYVTWKTERGRRKKTGT
jgi:5-methylcytosine-specific restriction endonuclease McrA